MERLVMPHEAVPGVFARSVLVLAPHPDDEVIGCGGAIALHVRSGARVRVVIATDGAAQGCDAGSDSTRRERESESRRAAEVLGYGEPVFWRLPDRSLAYGESLVRAVGDALEDADVVYAPGLQEMHPDHRALALAAAESLRRCGGQRSLLQYEVGVPLTPNLLLDITSVLDDKRCAIACFESQLRIRPYDEYVAALNRFRAYSLPRHVGAAEAFNRVDSAALTEHLGGITDPALVRQQRLGLPVVPSDLPLVSVIVRTMGRAECKQALDSIALQTYPNIEVVLVDAAGDTRAGETNACGRHPMRHVQTGHALGRSAAGNAGLTAAQGELLIFLDEDDVFQPDHVARLAGALRDAPGSDAACAGVEVHGSDGVIDIYDGDVDFARMLAWNRLPIHAVLFRRCLLEECRLDESLELYEDWDFWLQVAARTRFTRVAGVSAIYRASLGQSRMSDEAEAHARSVTRDLIRRRWLGACPPREFEWLIQSFRAELAERDRRIADLSHTDQQLREALEASRHEVNVVRHAASDASAQLEQRLDLWMQAREELIQLREGRAQMMHTDQQLREALEASRHEVNVVRHAASDASAQLEKRLDLWMQAREELVHLREERARIMASIGWRLMGPLRVLARAARRLADR